VYAIIEDSGTQIKVTPGQTLDIDLREGATTGGGTITFDRVLLVGDAEGTSAAKLGSPYLANATVTAEVLEEVKGDKLIVFKYKRRKGWRNKQGHRQRYLRVKIDAIHA
jgi:large subunit ribosomal protein L21